MKKIFFIFILATMTLYKVSANTVPVDPVTQVVSVDWKHFDKSYKEDRYLKQTRKILSNTARYNLNWIEEKFEVDNSRKLYIVDQYTENGIRPAASVCYGMAVALKCAKLNDDELGISREIALKRITMLIKGVAAGYKMNHTNGNGWGNDWQTALWTTFVGQGAWMLWDELEPETKNMVATMVVNEADRFIAPNYKVPYWTAPDGHVNSPGDTKAEENAWNATLLQLAVAMMPEHPHNEKWKLICSELMISSFSLKSDLENAQVIDGKPVKDWLHGFNLREDGAVINHNMIHPDYTMTITLNSRSYLVQPLANQQVSPASQWNASFIYHSLAEHKWSSPPYKLPGGAMFIPGKAEVYYPQGTDWSKYRFDVYYLTHVNAYVLGWDKGIQKETKRWMQVQGSRILDMQARHNDGHMFTKEEYPTYPGCEQMLAWTIGDAYLLLWLKSHHAISNVGKSGRIWLSKL
ncbi:MAG TPA: hypothetical protein VIL78_03140 [Hanamia sp.]|jgi:hypothetical protein